MTWAPNLLKTTTMTTRLIQLEAVDDAFDVVVVVVVIAIATTTTATIIIVIVVIIEIIIIITFCSVLGDIVRIL